MGTPDIAAHAACNDSWRTAHEVVGVYTKPDMPKNRGMKLDHVRRQGSTP